MSKILLDDKKRLKLAKELFIDLLGNVEDYPSEVEDELRADLAKCNEALEKIESGGKRKENNVEEKLDYVVWYNDSESKGKSISMKEKESEIKNSKKYKLFILREDTRTQVFVKGQKIESPPGKLTYRILTYILKHRGTGGTAWDIAKHVWDINKIEEFKDLREMAKTLKLQPRLNQGKMEILAGKTTEKVEYYSKRIRRRVLDLNKYLINFLTIKLEANKMDEYEFNETLEYCLIEKN